ncbi:SAP domain-containing protein [Microbacterium pygmaeum]|uniref:SAP domain-containing protein n=1 Tax=Microbacterium pygmaeum TaxID=370764 RepID=A0A1G8C731_9MICO|nr:SAP domain-containing protein [Microbacterium pygmaeum]SDH41306.1 hypothetical protein SAMN04489810_2999 [Microbacterium pygmaeum]
MGEQETRPRPTEVADERTLRRWYWLKSELTTMARAAGLPTGGGKIELRERIAAHLAGRGRQPVQRIARKDALPAHLAGSTLLEPGQRCTQSLRLWLRGRIGPSFRFDATMRDAVAAGGITLDQLAGLWGEPRRSDAEPAEQFELNRFSRRWHADHPGGAHVDMLRAWRAHRALPRD